MADTELQQLAKTDRNPVQETRYRELLAQSNLPYFAGGNTSSTDQFRAATGYGTGISGSSDPVEIAKRIRQFTIESNQPAISSLESSIPETSAKFATEKGRLEGSKTSLNQRYDALISELTRRESADVQAESTVKSREFGRRGIPLSSGQFDVELQEKLSPLRQFYTGQTTQAGIGREEGLRGVDDLIASLTGQETETVRLIRNAIGQLQTGEPASAVTSALNISQQQQEALRQARTEALQRELSEKQLAFEREKFEGEDESPFVSLGEGSTLFNILTGQPVYTAPKSYKPISSVDDWE